MKVLFINPACLDARITDDDALQVPIGLYYLCTRLLDQGFASGILNLAPAGLNSPEAPGKGDQGALELFTRAIAQEEPDIIGFSVTNPSRINAMACAVKAREMLPDALIVFGGPCPTFMADHLFGACPALDVIVKGEGEIATTALTASVQALKLKKNKRHCNRGLAVALTRSLEQIPGLVFQMDGTLCDTGPGKLVQDLDTLVHPSRYFAFQHLSMSRGCPGKCTFCGSPRFWGTSQVRRHSPEWFFDEIKALVQKGVRHFFISDDTFTMDSEAVCDLCQRIIRAKLDITWNAISRVDYLEEKILGLMRKAGCIQISFGVESGAEPIKKVLGKPIDNTVCAQAFDKVKKFGILPRAYFIYGSPGETDATIQDSIDLMLRLGPLSTVFYMLTTFPGTGLYTRALNRGWTDDTVWHREIEDLPWCTLDPQLNFARVKKWGELLRQAFFTNIDTFADQIDLHPDKDLAPFHADFLSRLAMTFSHGEYARDERIRNSEQMAVNLFEKALKFSPCARAFQGLAMIRQKHRDFSGALTLLEAGLTHFPDNKDLCVCKGVCLMNTGNFHAASTCFAPFANDPSLAHYITICQQQK